MLTLQEALASRDQSANAVPVDVDEYTVTLHWDTEWLRPSEHDAHASHANRGTCLSIDVAAPAPSIEAPTPGAPGEQWHRALVARNWRVVRIDGVADDELTTAAAELVDTARADAVHRRLIRERRDRTHRRLTELAAAWNTTAGAGERSLRLADQRNRLAARALATGDLSAADVQAAARLSDSQLSRAQEEAAEQASDQLTPLYLDVVAVAERAGVTPSTIRSYRTRGTSGLPSEDITIGDTPGWEWDTIETWLRSRRGRGWAAGTTADLSGHRQ